MEKRELRSVQFYWRKTLFFEFEEIYEIQSNNVPLKFGTIQYFPYVHSVTSDPMGDIAKH